jgi:hypothetical protein
MLPAAKLIQTRDPASQSPKLLCEMFDGDAFASTNTAPELNHRGFQEAFTYPRDS